MDVSFCGSPQCCVSETTVRERLKEFSETPAAQLSITEFHDDKILLALPESDPPAFKRIAVREEEEQRRLEAEQDRIEDKEGESGAESEEEFSVWRLLSICR